MAAWTQGAREHLVLGAYTSSGVAQKNNGATLRVKCAAIAWVIVLCETPAKVLGLANIELLLRVY